MKKIIFIFLILTSSMKFVHAQNSAFDTSFVFLSSNIYDFKNPTFENNYWPYQIEFNDRLAYEKHSGTGSDIIISYYTFNSNDTAITIISDNSNNTNPSFSFNMIVWQSDKNSAVSRQDLYYSLYDGVNWSSPALIDSSEGNKLNPNIHYSGYSDIYCLSYEKNDDIYFRYYKWGNWTADTNLTVTINNKCHSSSLLGNGYNLSVFFIQDQNDSTSKIVQQSVHIRYPLFEFQFSPQEIIYNDRKIRNAYLSTGAGEEYLNYEIDSSDQRNVYGIPVSFGNQIVNYTSEIEGICYDGKGSFAARVFENSSSNYVFCFGFTKYKNDTTSIVLSNNLDPFNTTYKEYYLGDSGVQTSSNISRPVFNFSSDFKTRAIWEKDINGKTAFIESDLIDRITSIKSENTLAEKFSLSQNYPNPFNPSTNMEFGISELGFVSLKVYNSLGMEVATIVNEVLSPGSYNYQFSTVNYQLPSGVYFYKLESEGFVETKRMVLLK